MFAAILGIRTIGPHHSSNQSIVARSLSPDGNHNATLTRVYESNLLFIVNVDGQNVHTTTLVAARADYRKVLAWNTNNQIVVSDIWGRRLFAYDAVNQRSLLPAATQNVRLKSVTP
jgi:hypothetical protein